LVMLAFSVKLLPHNNPYSFYSSFKELF